MFIMSHKMIINGTLAFCIHQEYVMEIPKSYRGHHVVCLTESDESNQTECSHKKIEKYTESVILHKGLFLLPDVEYRNVMSVLHSLQPVSTGHKNTRQRDQCLNTNPVISRYSCVNVTTLFAQLGKYLRKLVFAERGARRAMIPGGILKHLINIGFQG